MSYCKPFANHPKQTTQFQGNDRVARIKDGKLGALKWRPCPMNGHNDTAGGWAFEMDDGEVVNLNGYIHDTYPWRIPNRFMLATPGVLAMAGTPDVVELQEATLREDEDKIAVVCDLLDMIVDDKVATEDYNYVVEALAAMVCA